MLNRCDFRCVLKVENDPDRRRSTGRLFQPRKPATARARSPMVERSVAGTRTSAVDAERSRRRKSTSDGGWIISDRYCGAALNSELKACYNRSKPFIVIEIGIESPYAIYYGPR